MKASSPYHVATILREAQTGTRVLFLDQGIDARMWATLMNWKRLDKSLELSFPDYQTLAVWSSNGCSGIKESCDWQLSQPLEAICRVTADPSLSWSPEVPFDSTALFRKLKTSLESTSMKWLRNIRVHFYVEKFPSFGKGIQLALKPVSRKENFLETYGFEVHINQFGIQTLPEFVPLKRFASWLQSVLIPFRHLDQVSSFRQFSYISGGHYLPRFTDLEWNGIGLFPERLQHVKLQQSCKWKKRFQIWKAENVFEQRQAGFSAIRLQLENNEEGELLFRHLGKVLGYWTAGHAGISPGCLWLQNCRSSDLETVFNLLHYGKI